MTRGYSITLIVGAGFPGHASVQINGPDETTYAGLGPVTRFSPRSDASYDVVTLPIGASPVGAIKKDHPEDEYSYVDASKYRVRSYTFAISRQQALDAIKAGREYQRDNPEYNLSTGAYCTNFALKMVEAALPGADLSKLSRVPLRLQQQLDEASHNASMVAVQIGPQGHRYDTRLPSFRADETSPSFAPPPPKQIPPKPLAMDALHREFVRDSAAAAGVPDRYNVFEFGYPEPDGGPFSKQATPGNPASLDQGFGSRNSTYAGGGASNLSSEGAPASVSPDIPFAATPAGSLAAPGGSTLHPTPMEPGASGPFSTGRRFVPRSLPPRPLYPTGALAPASTGRRYDRQGLIDDRSGYRNSSTADDSFHSPVLRELQKYRQLAASGVAIAPSPAAPNPEVPRAPDNVGGGIGDVTGGVLKWMENGLLPSADASPSKPLPQGGTAADFPGDSNMSFLDAREAASLPAKDNRRYLSRLVAGRESAFDTGAPGVPFVSSNAGLASDHPSSFDDGFGRWIPTADAAQPGQRRQALTPLGLFTGALMPNTAVPLSILGLPVRSGVRGGSADDRERDGLQGTEMPRLHEYFRYLNREYAS